MRIQELLLIRNVPVILLCLVVCLDILVSVLFLETTQKLGTKLLFRIWRFSNNIYIVVVNPDQLGRFDFLVLCFLLGWLEHCINRIHLMHYRLWCEGPVVQLFLFFLLVTVTETFESPIYNRSNRPHSVNLFSLWLLLLLRVVDMVHHTGWTPMHRLQFLHNDWPLQRSLVSNLL